LDVVGVEVTTTEWADCEVFAGLLAQVDGAVLAVPPRACAVPWEEGHPRNRAVADVAAQGKAAWKRASGHHQRSLAENATLG
jgi:hypothetical protein